MLLDFYKPSCSSLEMKAAPKIVRLCRLFSFAIHIPMLSLDIHEKSWLWGKTNGISTMRRNFSVRLLFLSQYLCILCMGAKALLLPDMLEEQEKPFGKPFFHYAPYNDAISKMSTKQDSSSE